MGQIIVFRRKTNRMQGCDEKRLTILAMLIVYLILGLSYSVIIPPFEGLDEPGHFEVVRYIAQNGRLPLIGQEDETYNYRQEAAQPPLYYVLSASLVRVLGLQGDDIATYLRVKPRVVCETGMPNFYDNRAVFYHNPHQEAFPGQGAILMLYLLRAGSVVLQAITVCFTFALLSRLFPHHPWIALLATAIVAFNPQFLFMSSSINNDNLVTPLATIGLYLILQIWLDGLSTKRSVGIGLVSGLAGLSKLSGWLLLPLAVGVIAIQALRSRQTQGWWQRGLQHCALLAIIALTISSWWFRRNWQLYGDPTALDAMLDIVGRRTMFMHPLREGWLMFLSFWGQTPCAFYPTAFYIPFIVLTMVGASGLVWAWRRSTVQNRWIIFTLLGWFLLILLSWIRWDIMTYALGGRLLFPALPAVGSLIAIGIYCWGHHKIIVPLTIITLIIMAWVTVSNILPAFFSPPAIRNPHAIHPAYTTDAVFGEHIHLLGYDLNADPEKQRLDIRLYWLTTKAIEQDYTLALQLVSPAPGDTTLRWGYDSWPGRGNYPTSAWQVDRAIVEYHRFHIPEADFFTQAWDLQVILYDEQTMSRLPVKIANIPSGNQFTLERYRWPGKTPVCPEEGLLMDEVRFGDSIALTHAMIVSEASNTQVILCWKSLNPLLHDYHVLVHLYDAAGNLLQTGDGPPMNGAFPTSIWHTKDTILDRHYLSGTFPQKGTVIAVGWYSPADYQRLPLTVNEIAVPDRIIEIWPVRP